MSDVNKQLLEALKLADAMLSGANMNASAVERKVKAAIAAAEQAQQAEPVADVTIQFKAIKSARSAHAAGEISTDELRSRLDAIFGKDAPQLAFPAGWLRNSGWAGEDAHPPAVAVPDDVSTLLSELAAYAPPSGGLCAPTALQGFAIRAAAVLAAAQKVGYSKT